MVIMQIYKERGKRGISIHDLKTLTYFCQLILVTQLTIICDLTIDWAMK